MAERVSGPYRGYYISAAARLVHAAEAGAAPGNYVGSVSLAQHGPDDPRRIETLVELGDERRFGSEDDALVYVEQTARDYVDRLLAAN